MSVEILSFNIDDIRNDLSDDDTIPNDDTIPTVFSPYSQLDGNNDLLDEELEIISGAKTPNGKRVWVSPKRYIFWIKLKKDCLSNSNLFL